MLSHNHVFSHQHQFNQEPSWLQQQQNHHPQQQVHHGLHHNNHAQAVAQQNHFNRISANTNGTNGHTLGLDRGNGLGSAEGSFIEDNRRVLNWVAELLNGNSRETALMELSKKREQVPELALIIWHSFGKFTTCSTNKQSLTLMALRCNDILAPRDHLRLPVTQPLPADGSCFESRL